MNRLDRIGSRYAYRLRAACQQTTDHLPTQKLPTGHERKLADACKSNLQANQDQFAGKIAI